VAVLTLAYTSGTWTLIEKQRHVEAAEMKYLRNVAGYILKD
jgi:hypothetical protein